MVVGGAAVVAGARKPHTTPGDGQAARASLVFVPRPEMHGRLALPAGALGSPIVGEPAADRGALVADAPAGAAEGGWDAQPRDLYREIVRNGVAASGAPFVNLCSYDPARRNICGVVWAVASPRLVERALAVIRRGFPTFDVDEIECSTLVNEHVARVHLDGEMVVVPFREICAGVVHPAVTRTVERVMGLRTSVSIPLQIDDVVTGSLAFHFRGEPAPSALRTAEAFARQVTLTLQNASLSTELARNLDALRRSREDVIAAEERVRQQIAELLHGRVQSRLLLASLRLEQCGREWSTDPARARELLADAVAELDEIREREVRRASYLLHPSFIREGLGAAAQELVDRVDGDPHVTLEIDSALERLDTPIRNGVPEPLRLVGFRVIEEALANTLRHAGATQAQVRLGLDRDGLLTIAVADDGHGFDPAVSEPGLGFASIESRVAQVGGRWSIESSPGRGTRVLAVLPFSPARAADTGSASARD